MSVGRHETSYVDAMGNEDLPTVDEQEALEAAMPIDDTETRESPEERAARLAYGRWRRGVITQAVQHFPLSHPTVAARLRQYEKPDVDTDQEMAAEQRDIEAVHRAAAERYRTLTRLDEQILFGNIERGVTEYKCLLPADEPQLVDLGDIDSQTADRLVELAGAYQVIYHTNLRLVGTVAKPFLRQYPRLRMDIIQDGNEGLLKALYYFDRNAGYKFSTYAGRVIFDTIALGTPALNHAVSISPETLYSFYKSRRELRARLRREPLPHELAQASKITMDAGTVALLLNGIEAYLSLNQPLEGTDVELGDTLPCPDDPITNFMTQHARIQELGPALAQLSSQRRLVLALRFGLAPEIVGDEQYERLYTGGPRTQKQIGELLGLGRSTIQDHLKDGTIELRSKLRSTKGGS